MNKIIKNTLILTVITVVSGLLLGIVYGITKEPIALAQENAKQEAYQSVLSDAESFEEYADFDAEKAAALLKEKAIQRTTSQRWQKRKTEAAPPSGML